MHVRTPIAARPVRIVAFAAALLVPLLVLAAPPAHAGPLVASAPDCDSQQLETPFTRWGDVASYTLAPNGVAENRAGWSLQAGADVEPGNEDFYIHSARDRASLALPAGSSATTDTMCVGIEHPTLRLVARNTGSPRSALLVEVMFEDAGGTVRKLPIGAVVGGSSWQPSAPMPVIANLLPLLPGSRTAVAFRFTPYGDGGDWTIDDVYVDPWRHG
jgi:hypothetical protein